MARDIPGAFKEGFRSPLGQVILSFISSVENSSTAGVSFLKSFSKGTILQVLNSPPTEAPAALASLSAFLGAEKNGKSVVSPGPRLQPATRSPTG